MRISTPCSQRWTQNNHTNENLEIHSEKVDCEQPVGSDSEQEECDTCEIIFNNDIDLNEQQTNDNCGYGCTECGEYHRYEKDLKLYSSVLWCNS